MLTIANVRNDVAGEIEGCMPFDADGATAPETLRHRGPQRSNDLERGASSVRRRRKFASMGE
jgi:hypothetical protein